MREHDELDQLLDSALGTYAEPRPGIEQRILARVEEARAAGLASRRRWLVWSIAVPVTACILLVVMLSGVWQPQTNITHPLGPPEQAVVPAVERPQPETHDSVPSARVRAATQSVRPRSVNAATAAPKLDVFPAPQPLSEQEQALIALANQSPEVRREALEAAKRIDMPLQISAIQIPPISQPDEGKN